MTSRLRASTIARLVLPLLVWGCGGAAVQKDGGYRSDDPLLAAEEELRAAEARILPGSSLGGGAGDRPAPQPGSAPRPQPEASPAPSPLDTSGDADSCESACDALESMKKAAARICALAPGERCEAARARVANAEQRVMEACPGCET